MKFFVILFLSFSFTISAQSQSTYTFNGNGNWSVAANWVNNLLPPTNLPAGDTIFINTALGNTCMLDIADTISQGAVLIVRSGSNFIVSNGLFINNNIASTTICNQVWSNKNLDVVTYRNGDTIPQVTDANTWAYFTTGGAWCYYNNDPANNAKYGKLYNWAAVNDSRGLAPTGWHIPTDVEWNTLVKCLDSNIADTTCGACAVSVIAGGPLKATGTIEAGTGLWFNPNDQATNATGFAAVPGGTRTDIGTSAEIGSFGFWWSASELNQFMAFCREMRYDNAWVMRYQYGKNMGFSVRLVKD